MHYLLLQLSVTEMSIIIWNGIYTIRSITLKEDLSQRAGVHQIGLVILFVGQLITRILITIDRVLAVKLAIKYGLFVTHKKLAITVTVCWALYIPHGIAVHYSSDKIPNKIFSAWEVLVAFIIFTGYG